MRKAEFLEVKVQVFPDYSHYLNDQYFDLSDAYLKLNIRCGLRVGLLNGIIVVNDADNVIKNTGDLIFLVTVIDYKVKGKSTKFIFGTSHNDLTIMQNGDAVRTYNLVPYHKRKPQRFSKKLTNNAVESLEKMLGDIYQEYDLIKPKVIEGSVEAYVPSAIWVKYFDDYMNFVHDKGLSSENDQMVFCWYDDGSDIRIMDYETLIKQEPVKGLVMEEDLVGTMGGLIEDVPVFKYNFMTESNKSFRDGTKSATFITTSNEKNGMYLEYNGNIDSAEFIPIDRSCIYREMTYENGYEEMNKAMILSQYDAYSKFQTYGDMRLKPGVVMTIEDQKGVIKGLNIIDEVLYEFEQTTMFTHVFLMTSNEEIVEPELSQEVSKEGQNFPYIYGESNPSNYTLGVEADKIPNKGK